jgi:hypothetical protein
MRYFEQVGRVVAPRGEASGHVLARRDAHQLAVPSTADVAIR